MFPRKKNKYNAKRDLGFDSKAESEYHLLLKMRELAGEISNIRCQQSVPLVCGIRLRVDFLVFDHESGEDIFIELKGFPTREWKLKEKLWHKFGPARLQVWCGTSTRGFFMKEEICPDPDY